MSIWLLYLMGVTGNVAERLGPISVMSLILGVVGGAIATVAYDQVPELMRGALLRSIKCLIAFGLATGTLCILSPSRNDWYLIVGGYYATHIDGIEKLPPNVVAAMNSFLEEYGKKEGK